MSIYHNIYKPIIKIKDKIHDYITLTTIEYEILETDLFQRLRHISQSGFIFTVYPGNRISRFEHSLGCMYLSGLFIENMFINSSISSKQSLYPTEKHKGMTIRDSMLEEFLRQYGTTKDYEENKYGGYNKDKDSESLEQYIERLLQTTKDFTRTQVIEAIMWQSVRIAGLIHDIGHLPFSHDLEVIINKNINLINLSSEKKLEYLRYYSGKYHEFATMNLLNSDALIKCFENDKPIHNIVQKIFLSKNKYKNVDSILLKDVKNKDIFYTLAEIIDSDIDADRGDYLKRDGKSSGVEMGNYDLTRLVQNIELMMNEKKEFFIRPTQYASSIVEQFLMERYKIYQYVHFHQKSVFVNTLLSRIVSTLLAPKEYDIDIDTQIEPELLNYTNYIYTNKDDKVYRKPIDDLFIINKLRQAYGELCYKEEYFGLNDNESYFKIMIDITLNRSKNYIPLWKKNEDYLGLYRSRIKPLLDRSSTKLSLNEIAGKYLSDLTTIEELESIINKHIPDSIEARMILAPKHFKLFKENYFIINTKDYKWKKLNIKEFAPLLFFAKDVWENNVQVFCYAVLKKEINSGEILKNIQILTDSFIKGIAEWFESMQSYQ